MAGFGEIERTQVQTNPYLSSLVGDWRYRNGTAITYVFASRSGTRTFYGDGGAAWSNNGARAAFEAATETWEAVANLDIRRAPFYVANGTSRPAFTTWVERLEDMGQFGNLGEHDLPQTPDQEGAFNTAHDAFNVGGNARGGYNFITFIHEIGHALGLEHPHEDDPFPGVTPGAGFDDFGDFGLNQGIFTVMSYNDGYDVIGNSPSNSYGWQATPAAFDIAAVQAMYGANMSTNLGDTVYTLPSANGPGTFFSCIWDAGGIDTISAAGATQSVTIDLRAATLLNEEGGGGRLSRQQAIYGGFTIAKSVVIEAAVGGAAPDVLTGNAAANRLEGGGGADTLDGGGGGDTLIGGAESDVYLIMDQSVTVIELADRSSSSDLVMASASLYLAAEVENMILVTGSSARYGVGNTSRNQITGNEFANLLLGGDHGDTLSGLEAADALFGEDGNDQLRGGVGSDTLVGGNDVDILFGEDDPDLLYGEAGDDRLEAGDGAFTDILIGGDGDDTLTAWGGTDYDLMDGGAGDDEYRVDTFADLTFEAENGGIDLVIADIDGAGYYLYSNVENLNLSGRTPFGVGNTLANVMNGSPWANYLLGGPGDDTLTGFGGDDVLFGEDGADIFVFGRYDTDRDVIGDFAPGVDRLRLIGYDFTTLDQVRAAMVENDGTTAILLGRNEFIVINGVTNAQLSAADFIFG